MRGGVPQETDLVVCSCQASFAGYIGHQDHLQGVSRTGSLPIRSLEALACTRSRFAGADEAAVQGHRAAGQRCAGRGTHLALQSVELDLLFVDVQRRQLVEVGGLRFGGGQRHKVAHGAAAASGWWESGGGQTGVGEGPGACGRFARRWRLSDTARTAALRLGAGTERAVPCVGRSATLTRPAARYSRF